MSTRERLVYTASLKSYIKRVMGVRGLTRIFRVIGQNVLVKIYIMLVLRAEYGAY